MFGQETNQQNNQQTPVVPPTLPLPQDPGFMQTNPDDLSFLFNEESGQLEIVKKEQVVDPKFRQAVETQQTTQANQQIEQQVPQTPLEQEFVQLKTAFAQLVGYLQAKEQNLNNLTPPQEQTAPDYSQVDFTDPSNIVGLINMAVANAMKQHVEPLNNAVNQVQVKNNFDMTAAKYGKDFLDSLPKIDILVKSGILKSDPNMSFENIYLAFKQIERLNGIQNPITGNQSPSYGQSANSDSTIQAVNGSRPLAQPQTVQSLVQKAQTLSTETGGVQRMLINNEKPKVNSVTDAVEAAWNELFGQR